LRNKQEENIISSLLFMKFSVQYALDFFSSRPMSQSDPCRLLGYIADACARIITPEAADAWRK
jgi:hypothetical protein